MASHVVRSRNSNFYFVFQSPYQQDHMINDHVRKHGDGVYDIAFLGTIQQKYFNP